MEIFPSEMCRICENQTNLINISCSSNQYYLEQYLACADVTYNINDKLPQYFCGLCTTRLFHAYRFKQQCESTQKKLENLLTIADNKHQNNSADYDNENEELLDNLSISNHSMQKDIYKNNSNINLNDNNTQINNEYLTNSAANNEKECPFCKKQIPKSKYSKHITKHKKLFNCELCFLNFTYENDLREHLKEFHLLLKPFTCDLCNQSFCWKSNLKRHFTSIHFNKNAFKCDICEKSYKFPYLLRDHKYSHLSPDEREKFKKIYKKSSSYKICSYCGKSIRDASYAMHLKYHNNEKSIECNVCGKCFRLKHTYTIHMRTHTGDKPYKCRFCDMRFPQPANLRTHENMHKNVKPFKCDVCDMQFKQSQQLVTHTRVHTGEKPYKCEYCGKEFAVKANCRIHTRLHTGEKPFKCEMCMDSFIDLNGLKRHRKKMHSV